MASPSRAPAGGTQPIFDLTARTTDIARGDVLIFATDGIRRDFADTLVPSGSCRDIAQRILQQNALGSDDALTLVIRYLARA